MKKPTPARIAASSPDHGLHLAAQAFSVGRLAEAAKLCADLVKTYPTHAHGWHLRALVALAQNKPKLALDYLAKINDTPELLPSVAQACGRAHLGLGKADAALACFQEALGYQPDDAGSYHFLALALLAQGDRAAAKPYFRRATLLNPALGPAHYELGVLALAAGDARGAVTAFSAAAQHMPGVATVFNNLGLAQQAAGDLQAADTSFREALALEKDYAEVWYNLAGLLRLQGDTVQAAAAHSTALRLQPALRDLQQAT